MRRYSILAAAVFATSAFAQTTPDFTGSWKLNVAKSDFGPLPPPETRTDVITQSAAQIKDAVSSSGPDGKMDLIVTYNLDGSETLNQFRGTDVKSTAKWGGSALDINSTLKYQDQDIGLKTNWSLSADGKTLTMATHITSPMGEADQTLVLEKQDASAPATPATPPAPATPPTPATPPAPATPPTPAAAAARPNFTGTWKLNLEKSDFGPLPAPESRTDTIAQQEVSLKDTFASKGPDGDLSGELNYTTDGKESLNKFRGNDMKGSAKWDGASLVVENRLTFDGNDIVVRTHWDLSADGKSLTTMAHIESPMGEIDQKLVFDKQPD